jgi:hypothetical protein
MGIYAPSVIARRRSRRGNLHLSNVYMKMYCHAFLRNARSDGIGCATASLHERCKNPLCFALLFATKPAF